MPQRTALRVAEELKFQKWYKSWAKRAGIDPDPDNPLHKYDYRGAYKAGLEPVISEEDGLYHWDSQFKDEDHPNRYVGGIDTITGEKMGQTKKSKAEISKKAMQTLMDEYRKKEWEKQEARDDWNKAHPEDKFPRVDANEPFPWESPGQSKKESQDREDEMIKRGDLIYSGGIVEPGPPGLKDEPRRMRKVPTPYVNPKRKPKK
jgi:hypothetical protein